MVDRRRSFVLWPLVATCLSLLAERRYRSLPRLPALRTSRSLPSLTVLVPARNEEGNLRRLLPSLLENAYPGPLEVIVVDDDSSDATAAVAEEHGVQLIRITKLPDGWLGKPLACHRGAVAASGEWLLFTDADTVHNLHGLARAVVYAQDNNLDALSLWLQQETSGWLDATVMPVAFAGLFSGAASMNALLNGQYILLRREVYFRSDGFAAVRDEPVEDLALGHHLSASSYRVQTLRGEEAASVRMYGDAQGLWHGLTRLGGSSLRWLGPGSLLTVLLVTAAMVPILRMVSVLTGAASRPTGSRRSTGSGRPTAGRGLGQALLTWMATVPAFIPWARRFGSGRWAILAPVGAVVVQLAATWGLVSRLIGRGIYWRGRVVH
jgi:chlorobactene glucosyltransferase